MCSLARWVNKASWLPAIITRWCNLQIDNSLDALNKLTKEYDFVDTKTSSLNTASENLIQEQTRLTEISDDIRFRLKHFTQAEHLTQRLQNPTFTPASEQFVEIINNIDECLDYMKNNVRTFDCLILFPNYISCVFSAELQGVLDILCEIQAMFAEGNSNDQDVRDSSAVVSNGPGVKPKNEFKRACEDRWQNVRGGFCFVLWKVSSIVSENQQNNQTRRGSLREERWVWKFAVWAASILPFPTSTHHEFRRWYRN